MIEVRFLCTPSLSSLVRRSAAGGNFQLAVFGTAWTREVYRSAAEHSSRSASKGQTFAKSYCRVPFCVVVGL